MSTATRDLNMRNRARIIDSLQAEMVGPRPAGAPITAETIASSISSDKARKPHRQAETGEEILTDKPTTRYGVGVLYPRSAEAETTFQTEASSSPDSTMNNQAVWSEKEDEQRREPFESGDPDDLDLSEANAYSASSMAMSFLISTEKATHLTIEGSGGRYEARQIQVLKDGKTSYRPTWWLRRPVRFSIVVPVRSLVPSGRISKHIFELRNPNTEVGAQVEGIGDLDLAIEIFARPGRTSQGSLLLTVCLVNHSVDQGRGKNDPWCLFQSFFSARIVSDDATEGILPYPAQERMDPADKATREEEASLDLLYRDRRVFATGHGCSADWDREDGEIRARSISALSFPTARTQGLTPNLVDKDGVKIDASMAVLSRLGDDPSSWASLERLVSAYNTWIADTKASVPGLGLTPRQREAAERNIAGCETAAVRIAEGIQYLRDDDTARRAFRLANQAMDLQQSASVLPARTPTIAADTGKIEFDAPYGGPDQNEISPGSWRAFQIGFLLASVRSTVEADDPDHDAVELIWFPTGGGKTEAYLGLAAFSMFHRRLTDPRDAGVSVLMRYTLRLLTTQQFERASSLLCAMEYLRREQPQSLGDTAFSIGIWVGGGATPNRRRDALAAKKRLESGERGATGFVLERCPWCGAGLTPVEHASKKKTDRWKVPALYISNAGAGGSTVFLRCPDISCVFSDHLPVYVTDDDIYALRPSLVIGTIDKFAGLAWKIEPRALFGLDEGGQRRISPPRLIIQDELHLISGPLGSIAGLYESVIEDLCMDRRGGVPVRPKIVASTATIRRSSQQVRALYARDKVHLFPPSGIDVDDSFFAKKDHDDPGKIYVGIHAPSLGSVQTQWLRTFAALHQAPQALTEEDRDPWWTNLGFFNSIREMGTAHTLYDTDVRDYLKVTWNRMGLEGSECRWLNSIQELTGGMSSDLMKDTMRTLNAPYRGKTTASVDVCLASNVIEVGVDIQRLALMTIAGQPKTTSQYIQVSGRVGRRRDRPGLVVTLYSPSKPRDRSHFERFRAYHDRLYAEVEPTSVTPFSPPVLDRALHAAMIIYVRYLGAADSARSPRTLDPETMRRVVDLMTERCRMVDPEELDHLTNMLEKRAREWTRWEKSLWDRSTMASAPANSFLFYGAGEHVDEDDMLRSWPMLRSMRNVDAECEAEITFKYADDEEQ